MSVELLENINDLNLQNNVTNEVTNLEVEKEQKSFLESSLGQVINGALDIGLKSILPDFIENDVIDIKDALLNEGFSGAIKTAINKATEIGKTISGIFTGDFKDMSEVTVAVNKGNLIDKVSDVLDVVIKKAKDNNLISSTVATTISSGKKAILETASKNIKNTLEDQTKSINKLSGYISNWSNYYEKQDFNKMEKQYNNIEKMLEKTIPIEKIINQARVVENLHNLIKNNGQNFNISENEKELANILI